MVVVMLAFAATAAAQEKPMEKPPAAAPAVSAAPLAPADSEALAKARTRVVGLIEAIQAVQEKLDAAYADFNRTVQRVQAAAPAGMELNSDTTHYVPKPPKVDPPKAGG